jgi:membrane-associated protein
MTDALLSALPARLVLGVVLLAMIAESGLLIGFLVPGTAVALGAGAVAVLIGVPVPTASAAVAVGAICGGQIGFALGRRRRTQPAPVAGTAWLGDRVWPRALAVLRRRPRLAVAVGHWAPYGRIVVPRGAGWSAVSWRTFTVVQVLSATLWASALTVTGSVTTAAVRSTITVSLGLPVLGVVVLAAVVVLVLRAVRRSARSGRPRCDGAVRRAPLP